MPYAIFSLTTKGGHIDYAGLSPLLARGYEAKSTDNTSHTHGRKCMGASQPLLQSIRYTSVYLIFIRFTLALIAMFGGTLLLSTANAQTSQVSLVTLAT